MIIATILPPISQIQAPLIEGQNQIPSQQSQPLQTIQTTHDASVHQPFSLPHTPLIHQFTPTPQRIHATSQYVTKDDMIDVINQLHKQTNRPTKLDFTPPYPVYIRRQLYLPGHVEHPPQFLKYNGEKGNVREHITRFVELMSPWLNDDKGSNHNILLREFNKTLTDSDFSGYYNLVTTTNHEMMSFMDGFVGYNQIKMSLEDTEMTAFRTPCGNFYYVVMPFGLKNVGATYEWAMHAIFHDMIYDTVEDYVDDVDT